MAKKKSKPEEGTLESVKATREEALKQLKEAQTAEGQEQQKEYVRETIEAGGNPWPLPGAGRQD